MRENEYTGNYYTIGHLLLITGLTDRTLRNYLTQGFLEGEKINGMWHFTPEQVDRFLRHPSVRPSLLSRANSIVYDALEGPQQSTDFACIVLDFPGQNREKTGEYFCYAISEGNYQDIHFSFDGIDDAARVILRGPTEAVLAMVQGYYKR